MRNVMFKRISKIILSSCIILSSSAYATISNGPINDFQSGSVEGWINNKHVSGPVVQPGYGPSGADDFALWISAEGTRAGSRLVAINRSPEWRSAIDTNVTGLEMDLRIVDSNDLSIRIAISDGTGKDGTWFVSNTAHTLSHSTGGGWEHAFFDFADLIQMNGSATLASVLENVQEVRILHSIAPNFRGDGGGIFAVDNISAVPIPAAAWLFASALGFLGVHSRKA